MISANECTQTIKSAWGERKNKIKNMENYPAMFDCWWSKAQWNSFFLHMFFFLSQFYCWLTRTAAAIRLLSLFLSASLKNFCLLIPYSVSRHRISFHNNCRLCVESMFYFDIYFKCQFHIFSRNRLMVYISVFLKRLYRLPHLCLWLIQFFVCLYSIEI